MIEMGIFFNQIFTTAKLVATGSSLALGKFTFSPSELCFEIKVIMEDKDEELEKNCERMKRIARAAVRRKELGADLIEEVMYDTETRWKDGRGVRPMHLQTADMRMSFWKARNWNLMAVSAVSAILFSGGVW